MSKVLVNETSLNGIASAIREKNGETTKYKPSEMAAAISALVIGGGGSGEGDEGVQLHWEGSLSKWAGAGLWEWYFKKYGNEITTANITSLGDAFQNLPTLEEIPFDLNCKVGSSCNLASAFSGSSNLKRIGKIVNCYCDGFTNIFSACYRLRELPVFENFTTNSNSTSSIARTAFSSCYSLRSIPEDLLSKLGNKATSNVYSGLFQSCYTLDEIRGLAPSLGILTSNQFSNTFQYCSRLKSLVFKTKDDGSPYIVSWKNQTIELYNGVGWLTLNENYITGYNSGITSDKKISETNYQTLKNDPDAYTVNPYYSRFNRTSAVEFINSLPDASAYLATQSGGTNTIKFRQEAGGLTDGGQIGNLTEEEIAVATAKGWSVVYAV